MGIYGRIVGVVVALVVGLVGCVENRASVTILYNAVPGSDCTGGTGATGSSGTEGFIRTSGTLDISAAAFAAGNPRYMMFPVVQNNLVSTEEDLGSLVEQNIIELIEARVDLSGSYGGRFAVPLFVTLFPEQVAGLAVEVIPPELAEQLGPGVITVELKFLYELGAVRRETHAIQYSIRVCDGCLVQSGSACSSGDYSSITQTGLACNLTQDLPIQCCTGSDGLPICPAIDTSSPE